MSPSHGTRMRCPEDEIGRNSVSPWTTPRRIASNEFMSGGGAYTRVPEGRVTAQLAAAGRVDADDGTQDGPSPARRRRSRRRSGDGERGGSRGLAGAAGPRLAPLVRVVPLAARPSSPPGSRRQGAERQ